MKWNEVKNELPELEEDVLVYDDSDKLQYIVYLTEDENKKKIWVESTSESPCSWNLEDIEFWMPLPENPVR